MRRAATLLLLAARVRDPALAARLRAVAALVLWAELSASRRREPRRLPWMRAGAEATRLPADRTARRAQASLTGRRPRG